MKRFVEGEDRLQGALLPHCLNDYVTENNPVRVIEAFIDELDLAILGFDGVVPETTGRPAYHPATLLKIYLYGYLSLPRLWRRACTVLAEWHSRARQRETLARLNDHLLADLGLTREKPIVEVSKLFYWPS